LVGLLKARACTAPLLSHTACAFAAASPAETRRFSACVEPGSGGSFACGEPGPAVCAGNQSTDPALFAAEFWSAGGHTLFGEEFGSGSLKKRRKGTLHGRGRLGLRRVGVCMESDGGSSKQTTRGSKRTKRMRMKSQSRVNRACGRTESRRGRGRRVTLELTRYRGWRRSKVKEV
jgi:hypothetical protein